MNGVDMTLHHVAGALPNLQGERTSRNDRLQVAAIVVAVAVGVFACAGMAYGAYRLCDRYDLFATEIIIRKDGSQFERRHEGGLLVLVFGAILFPSSSVGIGFLTHPVAESIAQRLFLTRMDKLRQQVSSWQANQTPLASQNLVTLSKLARDDQLSALLPNMTVHQHLQLRAVVGVSAFERSVVAVAAIEVRGPWESLHLIRGNHAHIKSWLSSRTRQKQFQVNPGYLPALAQILGEQKIRVSDLQPELSVFYGTVNKGDNGFDDFARLIELAANDRRELRDGFVTITVDGTSHNIHAGLIGRIADLQSPALTEAQKRLLPRYLDELHMTTLRPSVADDLPSSDLPEMLLLITRLGSDTDSMRHFESHVKQKRKQERDAVTLQNLRQLWTCGERAECGWIRALCMEALQDPARTEDFKKDSLFALWPQLDMPAEILVHIDPRSQEVPK